MPTPARTPRRRLRKSVGSCRGCWAPGSRDPQPLELSRYPRAAPRGGPCADFAPDQGEAVRPSRESSHGNSTVSRISCGSSCAAGPSALNLAPVEIEKVIGHVCDLLQPKRRRGRSRSPRKAAAGLPAIPARSRPTHPGDPESRHQRPAGRLSATAGSNWALRLA